MKTKSFDCVEMKRKSQEKIYNEIKNLNKAEELEYWQKGTLKLKKQHDSAGNNKKKNRSA